MRAEDESKRSKELLGFVSWLSLAGLPAGITLCIALVKECRGGPVVELTICSCQTCICPIRQPSCDATLDDRRGKEKAKNRRGLDWSYESVRTWTVSLGVIVLEWGSRKASTTDAMLKMETYLLLSAMAR